MIGSALESLRRIQSDVLSMPIIYRHNGREIHLSAVLGKTVFRSTDEYGTWMRTESRDFIVPAGKLDFEPERGDVIVLSGSEYEVLAPAGEPVWRWSDPYRTAMRIHSKHTGGEG